MKLNLSLKSKSFLLATLFLLSLLSFYYWPTVRTIWNIKEPTPEELIPILEHFETVAYSPEPEPEISKLTTRDFRRSIRTITSSINCAADCPLQVWVATSVQVHKFCLREYFWGRSRGTAAISHTGYKFIPVRGPIQSEHRIEVLVEYVLVWDDGGWKVAKADMLSSDPIAIGDLRCL